MAVQTGNDLAKTLSQWQVDTGMVRERMYRAPDAARAGARARPLADAPGVVAGAVAAALGRDPHMVGSWLAAFRRAGPSALAFTHTGGSPPALNTAQQAALKAAVQRPSREEGIDLADWHWKVVWRFVSERFGLTLTRGNCLTYLHRRGFVVKRPTKRLRQADEATRAAFVAAYAALGQEATTSRAKQFFVNEAHVDADVDLHGTWVLKGSPALVDSTSPRYGEKARYSSAVCVETGEVEAMPLAGNSSAETSVAFPQQLRTHHTTPLMVFWDNAPAHGGDALRTYLTTPDLHPRLVRLPAHNPDFNADEHIWAWMREEVTANTCVGTADKVRAAVDPFFAGLAARIEEVKQRCRTGLQHRAEILDAGRTATTVLHDARKAA